jgi:hypothetical protein
MSDTEQAPKKTRAKKTASTEEHSPQSPTPTRYERNLEAEINPQDHDGGGSTEADTNDGSVQGESNEVVALQGSAGSADAPEEAANAGVQQGSDRLNDTNHTVEEKVEATTKAVESKLGAEAPSQSAPEGKIIKQGEEVDVPTEENRWHQQIATEDVWQEHTFDGSKRPTYTQVATKGTIFYPWESHNRAF